MFAVYTWRTIAVVGVLFVSTGLPWKTSRGEQPATSVQASQMLPDSIAVFAHAAKLGELVATVMNHPLRERVEALPAYQGIVQSDDMTQLYQGIGAFEASMGKPWQDSIASLTDGGVSVALDSTDGGFALLINSSDKNQLERFRGFLLAVSQLRKGKLAAAEQGEYRGFTAYTLSEKLKLAIIDHWLLITNKSELGKAIIDRYLDRPDTTFQSKKSFESAAAQWQSQTHRPPSVTAFFDVEVFRKENVPKGMYEPKIDNPLAEVILGGILANLRHAQYASATLDVKDSGLAFQVTTPHQRDWEPPREYYFGEPELAGAPPLLDVTNRLFAISLHRDLSQAWLRSGDLLTDRANDNLAKADTQLTTFFSGRDFGEDILGSFESGVQVVAQAQDFANVLPQPAIKLPAFAIQFQMKNSQETTPELRRVFQSFIGFLNVVGAMEGQPQLDLGMESVGDAKLYTATYVPDRDERESTDAPINFNFSPTIGFAGDRMILSSSIGLAKELAGNVTPATTTEKSHNTEAVLSADSLQQVLNANKNQLIANNMLEEGHDKTTAENEIGLLLDLVSFFDDATLELDAAENQLQLKLSVGVK